MARAALTAQTTPGAYPSLPIGANSLDLAWYAGDNVNGNEATIIEGKTLVLADNTDAAAQTITFTSVNDAYGRPGDITAYSIGIGEFAIFGPFKAAGWAHSGKLWIDVSDADVKLCVITLP